MRIFAQRIPSLIWGFILGSGYLLSPNRASAAEASVKTFVELKGAVLMTTGRSGLQVIKLADGTSIPVSEDQVLVREGMVFLETEVADAVGVPFTTRGTLLELVETHHVDGSSSHGHFGTVASTLGMVTGTMIVSSSMDDLSQNLINLSTTELESINDDSDTETLDGEEDAANEEEVVPPTVPNSAPVFDAAPTEGEVNESAANGTAVGAVVQASDADGDTISYTISAQEIDGAFSVDPSTGVIRIANSDKIDFESHETLDLTIAATDAGGAFSEQTVTIAIVDDPSDTLSDTPTYTVSHPEFSSGAFILSAMSEAAVYFGHAGITTSDEDDASSALIELFTMPTFYLFHDDPVYGPDGLDPEVNLSAAEFAALAEINAGELANGFMTLTSHVEKADGDNTLIFDISSPDFAEDAALPSPTQIKNVDQKITGTATASYHLTGSTLTKTGDAGFTQTETIFDVGPGDIWHMADLTGDDLAEFIMKKAGVGAADVYENLGTSFDTTPMAETILTGVNLDDLAAGRALDISIRDHFTDGNLTVMLLGETDAFLYELT